MHEYSLINSNERYIVPGTLGILSILIVLGLRELVDVAPWIPIPSVFAIFTVLYWFFEKYGWKWRICQGTFVSTPSLAGEWEIFMKSSLDSYGSEYEGTLTIRQTWTKISLYLNGEKFTGQSTALASIIIHSPHDFTLVWEYLAERKPQFAQKEFMHHGITKVRFENTTSSGSGNYYADQSRHSFGPVRVEKK